jgi:hypothetical protein
MVKLLWIAKWKTHQLITTKRTKDMIQMAMELIRFLKMTKMGNIWQWKATKMITFQKGKSRKSQRKRNQNFQLLNFCNRLIVKRIWLVLMVVKQLVQSEDLELSMRKKD